MINADSSARQVEKIPKNSMVNSRRLVALIAAVLWRSAE